MPKPLDRSDRISLLRTGPGSRTADPDASAGSLLEIVQLARQRVAGLGGDGHCCKGRAECMRAAEEHRELLDRTRARDGLREYVLATTRPWEALWMQIERAIVRKEAGAS